MMTSPSDLPFSGREKVPNTLLHLTSQIPELRLLADKLLCYVENESNTQAVVHLVTRCETLDAALVSWCETIPKHWKYTSKDYYGSIPDDIDYDFSEVYPGNIDTYPNVWVAKAWNSYRTARIFVQAIVLRCFVWLAMVRRTQETPQISVALKARETVKQMVDEICASVPFHMAHPASIDANYGPQHPENSSFDPSKPIDPAAFRVREEARATKSMGGYFLLWPLFVARSARITPAEQKCWITGRLLDIARKVGLDEGMITKKLNEPSAQGLFGAPTAVERIANNGSSERDGSERAVLDRGINCFV